MNQQSKIPDQETIQRHTIKMQEVCLMFDSLNITLNEAIASAEADIRNNPINLRRQERGKELIESYRQNNC